MMIQSDELIFFRGVETTNQLTSGSEIWDCLSGFFMGFNFDQ